jgi:hypothetical protein
MATLTFSQSDTELILSKVTTNKTDSDLGFFSKPLRVSYAGRELMVKKYLPVRDPGVISEIIINHDRYISELRGLGINVPDTFITTLSINRKIQIIIIQEAFRKDELMRWLIENSPESEMLNLCKRILDDAVMFWKNKKGSMDIGFHPTLRNYSFHEGNLFYFDTFPPMLMKQAELNKIIIKMSPFGKALKIITPSRLINLVSDEYYNIDKMVTGIIGSCCRLRPGNSSAILTFSRDYISRSSYTESEKQKIIMALQAPPRLSGIWTFIRLISGNVGKPNVKAY